MRLLAAGRLLAAALTLSVIAIVALAQRGGGGGPALKLYASAADVQGMMAKAKSTRKENQANLSQRIVAAAPYNANLEYRVGPQTGSVHPKAAEFFYVVDGAGTLTTGGTLNKETRGIDGGTNQQIAKGDFFVVPENTPHWFSAISSPPLVLMSLHVPRPVGQVE